MKLKESFMHTGQLLQLSRAIGYASLALVMVMGSAARSQAQDHDGHGAPTLALAPQVLTAQQNDLVRAVRQATERFKNVTDPAHVGDPYMLVFGCVSGGEFGAMGLHFLRGDVLHDGEVNASEPEILLFEPTRNGGIRLTGADFVVFKSEWEAKHPGEGPPSLNGQLFHLFDAPNRFGLDPFYTLHVWAWKDNPNGTFTNWNPTVSCDAFNPHTLEE
jgi:hypothetical protein